MNQDQVKEILLRLEPDVEEFSLIFSGKQSRRVNGLYHPETREIIIHNRNFADDNDLMYTAIHEFAHHIHFTRSPVPISGKAHRNEFWDLFHKLLARAEETAIYRSIFDVDKDFRALTEKIKTEFLAKNGELMKEFGRLLTEAEALCKRNNARFDDYVDRILGVHRTTARVLMRMHALNVNPAIGFENMRTVASLRSEEDRRGAESAFLAGKSPDMVKAEFGRKPKEREPAERLLQEKKRIEKTIASLTNRLHDIESRLERMVEA
jgi:hypothetical protein